MSNRNQFTIPGGANGDTTIGFTSVKKMENYGFLDKAKFSSYMMSTDKSHVKHLGLVQLYATTHQTPIPFLRDLFQNSAVLEVEEGQTITYDLPVNRDNQKCVTAEDTSDYQDYPGIDGAVFQIVLNSEFTKGDILGYDLQHGEQLMVSADHDVEPIGENFRHWVVYQTNDKNAWYPKDKLKAGIQYFKITNALAEFDTAFSGINMFKSPAGTITNEYLLGSPRGVETFMTREASRMSTPPGMSILNDNMRNNIQAQLEAMGGSEASMFYFGTSRGGNLSKNSMMVGTTLEYLMLMELAMMEAYSLLFAKPATHMTGNGVKRVTEGVWHQLRRGKLIQYAKEGGITIDHIREAASYIYRNNTTIPVEKRFVKFKCGYFAHMNVLQLFREHAVSQLTGLPAGMIGFDAQLPQKVFSGPLNALKMEYVAIQDVIIPGIGRVIAEHDPSLDYEPFTDRFSSGAFGQTMMAHSSYSMVIWDAMDTQYSNVGADSVKGAKLMEGSRPKSNIYYVKPQGPAVTWGYEQGRMANNGDYANVQSSLPYMGKKMWALSQSGALILDTTRYVVIEKQRPN